MRPGATHLIYRGPLGPFSFFLLISFSQTELPPFSHGVAPSAPLYIHSLPHPF
jgi:hypothetical protein